MSNLIGFPADITAEQLPAFVEEHFEVALERALELNDDNLDARIVPCRRCNARVGVKCRRPSGHNAWGAHACRWDDAVAATLRPSLVCVEESAV